MAMEHGMKFTIYCVSLLEDIRMREGLITEQSCCYCLLKIKHNKINPSKAIVGIFKRQARISIIKIL